MGSGIMLKNNETKYIIKVIRSLQNRGNILKETSGKIISQEGGALNFLGPLMKGDLPLMKNVLISLAKSVLIPLGLMAVASETDAAIQKNLRIRHDYTAKPRKCLNILKNLVY